MFPLTIRLKCVQAPSILLVGNIFITIQILTMVNIHDEVYVLAYFVVRSIFICIDDWNRAARVSLINAERVLAVVSPVTRAFIKKFPLYHSNYRSFVFMGTSL